MAVMATVSNAGVTAAQPGQRHRSPDLAAAVFHCLFIAESLHETSFQG
jgi:hypothetical protein